MAEKVICFRGDPEVHKAFQETVPHGLRAYVMEALMRTAVHLFSTEEGRKVVAKAAMGKYNPAAREVEKELTGEKNAKSRGTKEVNQRNVRRGARQDNISDQGESEDKGADKRGKEKEGRKKGRSS